MCYTEECDCSYPYDETPDVVSDGPQFDTSHLRELIECEAQSHDGHIELFTKWWAETGRFVTRPFNISLTQTR